MQTKSPANAGLFLCASRVEFRSKKRMKRWLLVGIVLMSTPVLAETDPLLGCPGARKWSERNEAAAKAAALAAVPPTDPERRRLLRDMAERDREVRERAFGDGRKPTQGLLDQAAAVDRHNSAVLRSWLDAGQLPTDAAVGADGMSAVWLLAQHADADPVLQAKLLEHYGAVPDFGGIEGRRYAMLVDRVLRAQGKPQRYGSQFTH
ncbi:DUF6624 domain-containing protein [Stenotrophomonas pictorum]|uniref:DUF6624 domain-containing protein n=1 Tax=Stenotrophomonas pictorum TaxID=86184 RepID=UPI0006CF751B|nr:DUF6624 domain-containing protein [Stenotrophomonas pictorum]